MTDFLHNARLVAVTEWAFSCFGFLLGMFVGYVHGRLGGIRRGRRNAGIRLAAAINRTRYKSFNHGREFEKLQSEIKK